MLGPARNPCFVTHPTPAGFESLPVVPPPAPPPAGDCQAAWVWLDPVHFPATQTAPISWWAADAHQAGQLATAALVRGRFELAAVPAHAWLRFSADSRARVWLNGRLVARGPAVVGGSYSRKIAPDWWYYDQVEIGALLQPERNILAAEIVAGPDNQTCFSQGHGGFLAELLDADGRRLAATGTGDWHGIAFTGYRTGQWTGLTRDCDARAWPRHWQLPDFDDRAWPPLLPDPTPRPALRTHQLPPLAETLVQPREGDSLTIPPSAAPVSVRVSFERLLAGHLQFRSRASDGTRLEIGFEEVPGKPEQGARCLSLILPGGEFGFESLAYFSARAVRLTVHFPPGAQPLELRGLGLVFRSQPVAYRGAFDCSDPFLAELWRVSRWSLQLCLQELHLDSPHHQEALGDQGDYLVEMQMGYYAFGDYPLAHLDLHRLSLDLEQLNGAQFHTSYTLLMPDLAADLLMFTGDAPTARATLPSIRRVLDRVLAWRGPEGLVSQAPDYMFIDWLEFAGTNYHHPPAAQGMGALTAFAVRALRQGAGLLRQLGESPAEAQRWEEQADQLAAAFREQLFDVGRGIFRDGLCGISRQPASHWLPADPPAPVHTRHTNILAVWAGIVRGPEAAAVLERVLTDPSLPEPQPYFQHYLFEALALAGLYEKHARRQLELWRAMLADHPHSLREMWGQGDYSHAWGGTPLVQLSRRVLGLEPTAPGWASVRLCPHPLDLDWARGVVPTPRGDIHIEWHRQADGVKVKLDLPEGTQVESRIV